MFVLRSTTIAEIKQSLFKVSPRIHWKGNSRYPPAIFAFSQREWTHLFPLCCKGKTETLCNSPC